MDAGREDSQISGMLSRQLSNGVCEIFQKRRSLLLDAQRRAPQVFQLDEGAEEEEGKIESLIVHYLNGH